MLIGQDGANGAEGAAPGDLIKDSDTEGFAQDVIEASKTQPVIVDFWAPWCGPCKQLTPVLEKLVRQYRGKVKLVKVNVDDNQELALQLRVQSIPAVFAFKDGRPVNGFMGAQPESQIQQFIESLTGREGNPIDELLAQAEALLADGQPDQALGVYQEILAQDESNGDALAGALNAYMALGEEEAAREVLDGLPPELADHPAIAAIKTSLKLKDETAGASSEEIEKLKADVAADPKNFQARFDLAKAKFGAGDSEGAIDDLLDIFEENRSWNDEAARKQLIEFFEALGPKDPVMIEGRKRLSSLLFA